MKTNLISFVLCSVTSFCQAATWQANPNNVDMVLVSAKAGDTVQLAQGTYIGKKFLIEKPIILNGAGKDKTFIKNGFRAWAGANPTGILINNTGGVIIRNLAVSDVSTANDEAYFGILVSVSSSLSNVTIDNVDVGNIKWTGSWTNGKTGNGIGVKVWAGSASNRLDKLTIKNSIVHDSKLGWGEAISLGGAVTNFSVDHNTVRDVDNIGIDAAGGYSWFAGRPENGLIFYNTVVRVNTQTNPAYGGSKSAAGIYVDGGKSINVKWNLVKACNFGISISAENKNGINARYNLIDGNTIDSPTEFAFNVGGDIGEPGTGFAFDNTFAFNTVKGSPHEAMVLFGRTRPFLIGGKANDWSSNTFTWVNKPLDADWFTDPLIHPDINVGDIQTDQTNRFILQ